MEDRLKEPLEEELTGLSVFVNFPTSPALMKKSVKRSTKGMISMLESKVCTILN